MYRTVILTFLLLSASCLQAAEPEYEGYKTLKGIEKVGFEINTTTIGAQLGTLKKELEDQAIHVLREHGIALVSVEEARKLPGQPILRISFIFYVDVKNNAAAIQCSIALTQKVTLVRDTTIETVEAKTWDNTSVTLVQPQHIKAASESKLADFIEQFIQDIDKSSIEQVPSKKKGEKSV